MIEIAEKYIELIRAAGGDPMPVLKRHNYELSFNCAVELSRYCDTLGDNVDDKFMLRIKNKYGVDKKYLESMDHHWDEISGAFNG